MKHLKPKDCSRYKTCEFAGQGVCPEECFWYEEKCINSTVSSVIVCICIVTWIYVVLASVLLLARFEKVEIKQQQIIQMLQLDHSQIIPVLTRSK